DDCAAGPSAANDHPLAVEDKPLRLHAERLIGLTPCFAIVERIPQFSVVHRSDPLPVVRGLKELDASTRRCRERHAIPKEAIVLRIGNPGLWTGVAVCASNGERGIAARKVMIPIRVNWNDPAF